MCYSSLIVQRTLEIMRSALQMYFAFLRALLTFCVTEPLTRSYKTVVLIFGGLIVSGISIYEYFFLPKDRRGSTLNNLKLRSKKKALESQSVVIEDDTLTGTAAAP